MIITWLPLPSYKDSIETLNMDHLKEQRVHVLRILETLHYVEQEDSVLGSEYQRMDASLSAAMWRGYELQLCEYGLEVCEEYAMRRSKRDSMYDLIVYHMESATSDSSNMAKPPWFGDVNFHMAHQAALVRLDPDHYKAYFLSDGHRELIWPESDYNG